VKAVGAAQPSPTSPKESAKKAVIRDPEMKDVVEIVIRIWITLIPASAVAKALSESS